MRRNAAFTLIEILLAAVAGALILSSVYVVFSRAIHLRNSATERTRVAGLRARAVEVIRTDLQNAVVTSGIIATALEGSAQSKVSEMPGYLRFATSTAFSGGEEPLADLQEVEYFVAADAEAPAGQRSGVLVRALNQNVLGEVQEVTREERLLTGVAGIELEFYDGTSWIDVWEVTEEDNTVPKAVRLRILQAPMEAGGVAQPPIEITVPWNTQPLTPTAGTV